MELSVMIVEQILSMFLMIAVGMMLTRLHIVGEETGRGLFRIALAFHNKREGLNH